MTNAILHILINAVVLGGIAVLLYGIVRFVKEGLAYLKEYYVSDISARDSEEEEPEPVQKYDRFPEPTTKKS